MLIQSESSSLPPRGLRWALFRSIIALGWEMELISTIEDYEEVNREESDSEEEVKLE